MHLVAFVLHGKNIGGIKVYGIDLSHRSAAK